MADDGAISAQEKAQRDEQLSCRFYEQEYPEVDECVMVLVKNIADMGAYVSLIEYNNIEGMILLSELSRRRIRSINKLIRVGKMEVGMVMRVDKEKGYIDLSRRRVTPEDVVKCEERYSKGKAVNSIMRHVAETTGQKLSDLNKNIAWPLARVNSPANSSNQNGQSLEKNDQRMFRTTYEAFRLAITDEDFVFSEANGVKIDERTKSALMKVIRRKLTPQPIRIRADIEVTCFSEEGIDVIKAALLAGENSGKSASNLANKTETKSEEKVAAENEAEEISADVSEVKIKLIAPPLYVLMTTALDKQKGLKAAEDALERVRQVLLERGGGEAKLEIKEAPRVTSAQDENELKKLMEQMEIDNTEVAGDDDANENENEIA